MLWLSVSYQFLAQLSWWICVCGWFQPFWLLKQTSSLPSSPPPIALVQPECVPTTHWRVHRWGLGAPVHLEGFGEDGLVEGGESGSGLFYLGFDVADEVEVLFDLATICFCSLRGGICMGDPRTLETLKIFRDTSTNRNTSCCIILLGPSRVYMPSNRCERLSKVCT